MSILDRVINSFESLGGVAKLKDIHQIYKNISSKEEITKEYVKSIQARIQENSKNSSVFKGKDIFRPLYEKGDGVWYLKDKFKNVDEAKFIFEFKERNLDLWDEISNKKIHTNDFVRNEKKIHRGERGIYRDLSKTKKHSFTDGICQSVLDTGRKYDDVLTETHLTYYYPDTSHKTRDKGEINSLKNSYKYNIPIFVVLGLGKDKTKKELRLGYVQRFNDNQKTFLISFVENSIQKILPIDDIIESQNEDESQDQLFASGRERKKRMSSSRGNNQPKFNSDVFNYYQNQCAVCNIKYFLDAAHIVPVKDKGSDNKRNGLILCKNHHKAFDDGFFKINPNNLKIEIIKEDKNVLNITRDNLNHLINKPGKMYLEWRYKKYKK